MSDSSRGSTEYEDRMSPNDAILWQNEIDPMLRSTILSVLVLSESPDLERIDHAVQRALRHVPRLRQRVVEDPLGVAPPRWESDPNFALRYHWRRVRISGEGSERDLLDLAQPLAMQAFDKDRPLWEMLLVEGLEGGRAALVMKLHHAISDGVGLLRMTSSLVERDAEPRAPKQGDERRRGSSSVLEDHRETPELGPFDRMLDAMRHRVDENLRAGQAIRRIWTETLFHPRRALETTRSIARTLRPVTEPMSPILRGRSLEQHFDVLEVKLETFKQASKGVGGSLNDAFVGAMTGGLRRYHQRHGRPVDELRMTMPINLRAGDSGRRAGNQFAPARFSVPIGIEDPAERMSRIGELVAEQRGEPALPHLDQITGVLGRLPLRMTVGLLGSMLKSIDFVTSNVPGPPFPVFAGGAHVERMFGFGPLSGAALNLTLFSYDGVCQIGVNMDCAAVRDPEVLVECLREGVAEVLALA